MRKTYAERLNEILDAAAELFIKKSYENATVNDILEKVQIGKGTFYHYFNSKEEVMEAVVDRMVDSVVSAAKRIAEDRSLGAHDKMKRIILAMNISGGPNGEMIAVLHQPASAKMHQNSIVAAVRAVAPVLSEVVKQGIREGVYDTPYPQETMELLLVANQSIFDEGIFQWGTEELKIRAIAFVRITELALGAKKGSFDFVLDPMVANIREDNSVEK